MAVSRRKFLAGAGTLTAIAAAAPLTAMTKASNADVPVGRPGVGHPVAPSHDVFVDAPQYKTISQYQFTPELFKRLIGETFQVKTGNGTLVLRLNSVETYPAAKVGQPTRAFAIGFSHVKGTAAKQGTYEVRNPALGDFLLFIVPASTMRRPSYTAIVNHL